ncbi:hypothetical protein GP486_008174 [Trichoglossum hirsutum]|uniref:Uncharacterized protein n=1 Tax=Trichoglossum hirsutum TaxID=265104 RepID=A0A9P8IE69_9PEZI|nr:hypothetical protein GP486_008174 [Trichoglossum hirsutum]
MKHVIIILSTLSLLRAHKVLATPINTTNFDIQPDRGGSPADDCGDGNPVTLDADSWIGNHVDTVIGDVWSAGESDPNFDFHQNFSRKYGVSLYCPDTFTACTGAPSSCSALIGTVAEKKQGWLGIKALLSLQQQFLEYEKAITLSMDGLTVDMVNFQKVFAPPDLPDRNTLHNLLVNLAVTVFSVAIGAGLALLTAGASTVAVAVWAASLEILGTGLVSVAGNAINDGRADSELSSTDFSILTLSDTRTAFKQAMLYGLDKSHNATFSNGKAGAYQGPPINLVLEAGTFVSNTIPQVYAGEEDSLQGLVERIMTSKLLEAVWTAENAFLLHVNTETDPVNCAWRFSGDFQSPDVRLCGGFHGMFVLGSVTKDSAGRLSLSTPPGSTTKDVADISTYGMQLADLIFSAAELYLDHGLNDTAFQKYLPDIFNTWTANPSPSIFKASGMFVLPVCEMQDEYFDDPKYGRMLSRWINPACGCRK